VDGAEMFNQFVETYMAGAKYEVIFDYPQIDDNPYGILTEDHFTAIARAKFWNNLQTLKVNNQAQAAFVMPHYSQSKVSIRNSTSGIRLCKIFKARAIYSNNDKK
jgi:hypothetical protein